MSKKTVKVGGRDLTVGPANLKTVKQWMRAQQTVRAGTLEYIEALSDFLFGTLKRWNPDIEQEWLDEHLDERQIPGIVQAIYAEAALAEEPGEVGARN